MISSSILQNIFIKRVKQNFGNASLFNYQSSQQQYFHSDNSSSSHTNSSHPEQIPAEIINIHQESPKTKRFTLRVKTKTLPFFTFYAGQFINLYMNDMTASFSISSAPKMLSNEIEITVQRSNHPLTHLLHDSKVGDLITISGPLGNFYFNVSEIRFANAKHLVLIAGGLGVTPLISIIKYISGNMLYFYHVTLIYSASTVDDFCFVNDISNIIRNFQNINCKLLASTPPSSSIPQELEPLLTSDRKIDVNYLKANLNEEQRKEALFFVCGPISMVKDISAALQELSVDTDRIYHQ